MSEQPSPGSGFERTYQAMTDQVTPAAQPEQTVAPTPEPLGKKSEAPAEGLKLMRKPFPDNQISILCKTTHKDNEPGRCKDCGGWHKLPSIPLSYVGHAALTDRLLDADPLWTWEPLSYGPDGTPFLDAFGGLWIKLTVAGVTRLGYGDAQGKVGGNAMKERIGDALRNAAMRFGAALDLWHKGDLHVDPDNIEEKAAAENEATHLTKFKDREAKQEAAELDQRPENEQRIAIFQIKGIDEACKRTGKTESEVLAYLGLVGHKRIEHLLKSEFPKFLEWANSKAKPVASNPAKVHAKGPAPEEQQRMLAMKRLWAVASEFSIPEADVKTASYEKFGVDSMTKLNAGQLDEMTAWVRGVAEAVKNS